MENIHIYYVNFSINLFILKMKKYKCSIRCIHKIKHVSVKIMFTKSLQ